MEKVIRMFRLQDGNIPFLNWLKALTGRPTRRRKIMPTVDYDTFLSEQLQDLDFAAGYLAACLEEGEDVFLLGVRNLAKAKGGMKLLSEATSLNRESLYDMLSESGNPLFRSITSVLSELGLEVSFQPKKQEVA